MFKKGQITIFIIIAILLVAAVGIVLVLRNSMKTGDEDLPVGTENVENYVKNCLKIIAENGIVLMGRQGGYYKFSSEPNIAYSGNDSEPGVLFTDLGNINVPYYLYDSKNTMPPIEKVEEQLSFYVEENLNNCIKDFDIFKQKGFIIDAGSIDAATNILDDKVMVSLDYPVTMKKADIIREKTTYNIEVPIRMGLIYNITDYLTNVQASNPRAICFDCLLQARNNGFYTQMLIYDNNTIIFVFTDTDTKLNNTNFDFIFANKY